MVNLLKNIIIVIILFFLTEYGKYNLSNNVYFNISEVNIKSNNSYLIEELIENLKINFIGENILYIDENVIKNKLTEDIRLNEVNFEKKLPNVLNIDLVVREPAYYVLENDKLYVADKTIVKYAKIEEEENQSLPILKYSNDEIINNNLNEVARKLFGSLLYSSVSEIKENGGIYILLLNDGVEIYTNVLVEQKQYNDAFEVYSVLRNTQEIDYIDTRFNNIVVK